MEKLSRFGRNTVVHVFLILTLLLISTMPASAFMQNEPTITNSVNGYLEEYYGPPLPIPPSPPVSEYILTATNLTDDLVISASTSYSWPDSWGNLVVSLSPTEGYANQIIIPSTNGNISATVYVKTGAQFIPGDCYGTIIQTSTGASVDSIEVYIASYLYVYSPVTYIGQALQYPGSIINLPLTTEGFNHVGGFQYHIDYDPSVLSFLSLENLNPLLPCIYEDCEDPIPLTYIISSVTNINPSLSRLNIALVDEIDGSWSVPDGAKLFDLSFYYTGGFSDLVFDDVSYYYSETAGVPYTVIDEPQSMYYHNGSVGPANITPTITINPGVLSFGDVLVGTHSAVQTYSLTGSNLTAPVTVTAAAGSAIQNVDGYWVQTIDLPPTEGNLDATVTVCFKPYSASVYSENITNESAGANGHNLTVTGTGMENNNPYIIIEPEALDMLYTDFSNPCSSTQIYRINGCNLTENLNLSNVDLMAEFSLTGENDFTRTLALIPVNGVVDTSVYVRLCPFDHFNFVAIINNSSSGVSENLIAKILSITGNAPVTNIGEVTAAPGTLVNVPVTVIDFVDIWQAQYNIEFDPTILTFQYLDNIFFDIWPHQVSVTQIDSTHSQLEINIVCGYDWAMTAPDNEKLFDLVFTYSTGYSSLDFGDCFHTHFWTGILNDEPYSQYYHNGSVGPNQKSLNLELNLEGLYNPSQGDMNQAYGRDFPDTIADEITIGIAQSTFPYTIEFEIDSVLLERTGHCQIEIPGAFNGEYYFVIKHRNSIETWSKYPVPFNTDSISYNFTDFISKAYNNNLILKGISYCIYAADINQDGFVDTWDMSIADNESSQYVTGYNPSDANGDGNTDTGDLVIIDNNSNSYITAQRPFSLYPIVITSNVSSITNSTAICGGLVIDQGSSPVISFGVCWSTSPNPDIADSHTNDGSGTGTFISNLTGLTPSSTYFVRAYATNNDGTTYGNEVSFITGSCGASVIRTHFAGSVAPVDKTVTYGTVETGLSGSVMCWITQNLGADNLAASGTDATEASAGWYWQYSGTQGFKHDGTTRTPNTVWSSVIHIESDWSSASDPCRLLLGNGWRLPTQTEWETADDNGDWDNYNETFSSVLKLHAAGSLGGSDGSLGGRGSNGTYWSSSVGPLPCLLNCFSGCLSFNISSSYAGNALQRSGQPVRCLNDGTFPGANLPTVITNYTTNITSSTATSGGEVIFDGGSQVTSRGVCWSTSQNPTLINSFTTDGIGTGAFISNLTGLLPLTTYYVRAYATNTEGTAYGNQMSLTTLSFICGSVFTINHEEGTVSPVNKIVYYGTVLTNLTGENKCWITQNLGASNQADSEIDATETSAGWYWQFNRQQGFKYDGATRTPNTTWITYINDDSEWLHSNDPCKLLLGISWRIPTTTEWGNADSNGGWDNYSETYASALKLHAAGVVNSSDGLLGYRGSWGNYWSSSKMYSDVSWGFCIGNGVSNLGLYGTALGFPLRCLKD